MKHVKIKHNKSYNISFDPKELDEIEAPEESKKFADNYFKSKSYSVDENHDLLALTDNGEAVYGFDYIYKNEKVFIPELNPVLIYFSNAQMFSKMIYEYKKGFLKCTSKIRAPRERKTESPEAKFEWFVQFASSYIIMLHASIEAFTNKIIPLDQTYNTSKDKIKSIDWILKHATLEQKIEEIIPAFTNKSFHIEKEDKYNRMLRIKEFRNELIHLKPKTQITNTKYKEFYRKVIDFPYSEAIYSARDYINFYEPGLIEECNCGKDIYFDIHIKS